MKDVFGRAPRILIVKLVTVLLVLFGASGTSYSAEDDCWTSKAQASAFGRYEITEYKRYGGSPITEDEVAELASGGMVFQEHYFGLRQTKLHEPYYHFRCQPAFMEGDVPAPADRRSNFYGFGADRDTIKIIDVYADKGAAYPLHTLEVVGQEVWELYAGWFFKMKRVR